MNQKNQAVRPVGQRDIILAVETDGFKFLLVSVGERQPEHKKQRKIFMPPMQTLVTHTFTDWL